jgi:hypothetical protein
MYMRVFCQARNLTLNMPKIKYEIFLYFNIDLYFKPIVTISVYTFLPDRLIDINILDITWTLFLFTLG